MKQGTSGLIAICALIYFLDGLIHSVLGPLAPQMARSLSLASTQLGPIFSANLIGQCIGLVVLPMFGARLGQRRVVLFAVVGFGVAQAASALANGPTSLFVLRLVTGVFLGGCLPGCLAMVTAAAPAARRGVLIMVLFTGYGLGATVAGLVAAAFANFGGWRMSMVVVGAACLLTALFGRHWLREPAGAAAAAPGPATPLADALQILAPRYLVATLMLWLLFVCMLTISYCLNSWLPTLLVEVGRSGNFAAMSVSVFSLGGIVAALGVGMLIDRFGALRTLVSFLCISTLLLYAVGQVLDTASGTVLMGLLAACGFFVLGAYGGVNVVLATAYSADVRAIGIGWAKTVGRAGTVLAPVLIGIALTAGMAGTSIMSLFAVPALLAALSLLLLGMHQRLATTGRQAQAGSAGR
jgi:AAHS family 4-hydroxybenzoate transporter-like MFS transporter